MGGRLRSLLCRWFARAGPRSPATPPPTPAYPPRAPCVLPSPPRQEHLLLPMAVSALVDGRITWREDGIPILWNDQ